MKLEFCRFYAELSNGEVSVEAAAACRLKQSLRGDGGGGRDRAAWIYYILVTLLPDLG